MFYPSIVIVAERLRFKQDLLRRGISLSEWAYLGLQTAVLVVAIILIPLFYNIICLVLSFGFVWTGIALLAVNLRLVYLAYWPEEPPLLVGALKKRLGCLNKPSPENQGQIQKSQAADSLA